MRYTIYSMVNDPVQQAIRLIRTGKKDAARELLIKAVQANPADENAWLWLVETLTNDSQRIAALQTCLKYIPGSQKAQRGLQALQARPAASLSHAPRGTTPSQEALPDETGAGKSSPDVAESEKAIVTPATKLSDRNEPPGPPVNRESPAITAENLRSAQTTISSDELHTQSKPRRMSLFRRLLITSWIIVLVLVAAALSVAYVPQLIQKLTNPNPPAPPAATAPAAPTALPTVIPTATLPPAQWLAYPSMHTARAYFSASRLDDGRVLVAGGWDGTQSLADVEIFDPEGNRWEMAAPMNTDRAYAVVALLNDGRVLVVGGETIGGETPGTLSSAELFDPETNTWSLLPNQPTQCHGKYAAAVTLDDGRVLVVGGVCAINGFQATAGAEVFDPNTGQWTTTEPMTDQRSLMAVVPLMDGTVLVTGGGSTEAFNSAEVFNPPSGTWMQIGALSVPRLAHTATLLADGRVLVVGGIYISGIPINTAEIYEPFHKTWSVTPAMRDPRFWHSANLLRDGRVLVAGGKNTYSGGNAGSSVEIFSTRTNTWEMTSPMQTSRAGHCAILLPDGRLLVMGGEDMTGRVLESSEAYQP